MLIGRLIAYMGELRWYGKRVWVGPDEFVKLEDPPNHGRVISAGDNTPVAVAYKSLVNIMMSVFEE